MVNDSGASSILVAFYRDGSKNSSGSTLEELWELNYDCMEYKHDWIQWMFPIRIKSKFNKAAEVLTDETIAIFRSDQTIQSNMRKSIDFFLDFLGLELRTDNNGDPLCTRQMNGKLEKQLSSYWGMVNCAQGNHNWRRITRFLESLVLCDMEKESLAIYEQIKSIYVDGKLKEGEVQYDSMVHWMRAVGKDGEPVPVITQSCICNIL